MDFDKLKNMIEIPIASALNYYAASNIHVLPSKQIQYSINL